MHMYILWQIPIGTNPREYVTTPAQLGPSLALAMHTDIAHAHALGRFHWPHNFALL